jgi:hypothetical protein
MRLGLGEERLLEVFRLTAAGVVQIQPLVLVVGVHLVDFDLAAQGAVADLILQLVDPVEEAGRHHQPP